jgi:hypothetical protein
MHSRPGAKNPTARDKARLFVRNGLDRGLQPSAILRELEQQPGWAPSRATIYNWAREWRTGRRRDSSPPWSLADADETSSLEFVLRVIDALTTVTDGREQTITRTEAAWVVRFHRAFPGIGLAENVVNGKVAPGFALWGVLEWARQFAAADSEPDADVRTKRLVELTALAAGLYAELSNELVHELGKGGI